MTEVMAMIMTAKSHIHMNNTRSEEITMVHKRQLNVGARPASKRRRCSSSSGRSSHEEGGSSSTSPSKETVSQIISAAASAGYEAPLKCPPRNTQYNNPHASCFTSTREKSPAVRFRENVLIQEIPSHRTYTSEARNKIWTCLKDIHRNAKRNELEFGADREDWRRCTEEDQFCLWRDDASTEDDDDDDSTTPELIHPYTFERYQAQMIQRKKQGQTMMMRCQHRPPHQSAGGEPSESSSSCGSLLKQIPKVSSFQDLSGLFSESLAAQLVG